ELGGREGLAAAGLRVRREDEAVGDRGLRERRIAEELEPELLAGAPIDDEERAALGVEDEATVLVARRGRPVVLELLRRPEHVAVVRVEGVHRRRFEAARDEDAAVAVRDRGQAVGLRDARDPALAIVGEDEGSGAAARGRGKADGQRDAVLAEREDEALAGAVAGAAHGRRRRTVEDGARWKR